VAALDRLASRGARVLGVAFRMLEEIPASECDIEVGLTIIGMVALVDPARRKSRPPSKPAVQPAFVRS
jgi:magnesium-transporting ATPase (P-type)